MLLIVLIFVEYLITLMKTEQVNITFMDKIASASLTLVTFFNIVDSILLVACMQLLYVIKVFAFISAFTLELHTVI